MKAVKMLLKHTVEPILMSLLVEYQVPESSSITKCNTLLALMKPQMDLKQLSTDK